MSVGGSGGRRISCPGLQTFRKPQPQAIAGKDAFSFA